MNRHSVKKMPAKGSFSLKYLGSKTPEPHSLKKSPKTSNSPHFDDSILSQDLNDMCQYAQIALQKTSEVQEDITKLLGMWDNEEKSWTSEELDKLNRTLIETGFRPIRFPTAPNYSKLIFEIINEVQTLRNEIMKLRIVNNESLKSIEQYKKNVKDLENEIKLVKNKIGKLNQVGLKEPNCEKKLIFEIKKNLECEKDEDALRKSKSFGLVLKIMPKLERFVEGICKEFVPEIDYDKGYNVHPEALGQVFERIQGFKSVLQDLSNFKINIYAILGLKISGKDEGVYFILQELNRVKKEIGQEGCKNFVNFFESVIEYFRESQKVFKKLVELCGVDENFRDLVRRHSMQKFIKTKIN